MHHQQLKNNYVDQSGAYDYQAAVVQGRIDLPQVQRLFPAIAALPETRLTNVIHAPATLHYYHAIGDRTPAYTIEKGTRIRIRLKQLSLPDQVGYGLYSLPTDVAGWRLAVPFHVEHVRAHHPLLYVKQDELLEVARLGRPQSVSCGARATNEVVETGIDPQIDIMGRSSIVRQRRLSVSRFVGSGFPAIFFPPAVVGAAYCRVVGDGRDPCKTKNVGRFAMIEMIRSFEDVLTMLDALLEERRIFNWDAFYSNRERPVPFFIDAPDENLVQYLESGLFPPGRALELGCGPGRNAIFLAKQDWKVDAVDLSSEAIQWAKERAAEAGVEIHFIPAVPT